MHTKREVLRANLTEWLATKPYSTERRELTVRLAQTLNMHPRSISRAMRREQMRSKGHARKAGRPRKYTPEVDAALRLLFDEMGRPCAENMQPVIEEYIMWLKHEKQWSYSLEVEKLVKSISLGSLKGRVRLFREKDGTLRGYSATTPSTLHILVPIRKSHTWAGLPPGYVQMDTVVHCGDRLTDDGKKVSGTLFLF